MEMAFPPEVDQLDQPTREALERSWLALLVAGIVAVIIGIIAIVIPAAVSAGITILIGILLLVAGVVWIVGALSRRSGFWWTALGLLVGVVLAATGIWAIVRPLEASVTLTALLAVVFIVVGGVRLIAAIGGRTTVDRWVVGLGGAVSVLVGVFIAVELPSSADWAIGLLVGIVFLVDGLGLIAMALVLRKGVKELARPA